MINFPRLYLAYNSVTWSFLFIALDLIDLKQDSTQRSEENMAI